MAPAVAEAAPVVADAATADAHRVRQAEALLAEDRAALVLSQPFVGHLAMHLEIVVGSLGEVMAVDGQSLFFDTVRVLSLTQSERRFLLAHGVWHCALLHPFRRAGRDHARWDLAIDAEVNGIVSRDWLVPEAATVPEEDGRAAEQIFASLDPGDLPARGLLADAHWDPPDHDLLEAQWQERLMLAMRSAQQAGSDLPGAIERLVVSGKRSKTPWRALLRSYVTEVTGDTRAWLPPNRRSVHRGLFLPSRRAAGLRLAVLLDTSASTEPVQPAFLSELEAILRAYERYELVILQGDAAVQKVSRHDAEHPWVVGRMQLLGLGGTSFVPAFERIERESPPPSVFLVFTDGQGVPPRRAPPFPVIWALSPGGSAPVPWGRRVCLSVDEAKGLK